MADVPFSGGCVRRGRKCGSRIGVDGLNVRLADFIDERSEAILLAAEQFTATLTPAAGHLDSEAMRDHLPMMLGAIAADLRAQQTVAEELQKALGHQPRSKGSPETAAELHAVVRAVTGFSIEQVVSEFRALRASVLRLWLAECGAVDSIGLQDIARFNEAIDQALAESVSSFSAEADRWRQIFLAVLGHDLRVDRSTPCFSRRSC